jgi:hypothetical protein
MQDLLHSNIWEGSHAISNNKHHLNLVDFNKNKDKSCPQECKSKSYIDIIKKNLMWPSND